MKRSVPNDRPTAAPVTRIVLPEGKLGLRAALLAVSLVIAAVSLAYGVHELFATAPGVQEIEALSAAGAAAARFTLYYDLGRDGADAGEERRALRDCYTRLLAEAQEIFGSGEGADGLHNAAYLNAHPNEAVSVDGALYQALALLERSGSRLQFLAPLGAFYTALLASTSDQEAAQYDPRLDRDVAAFFAETAAYIRDEDQIRVRLLEDSQVCLEVSEAYLAYAEANGISELLDLSWLTNAFITDYVAEGLRDAGFRYGVLMSEDGFTRCFDRGGTEYRIDFTHRQGGTVSAAGALAFGGEVSLVYLRDYPADPQLTGYCYTYADGTVRSRYLDAADGLDRTSLPEIAGSTETRSCAETALLLAPVYIADAFDVSALETLANAGITVYYTESGTLLSS